MEVHFHLHKCLFNKEISKQVTTVKKVTGRHSVNREMIEGWIDRQTDIKEEERKKINK